MFTEEMICFLSVCFSLPSDRKAAFLDFLYTLDTVWEQTLQRLQYFNIVRAENLLSGPREYCYLMLLGRNSY